MKRINEIFYSLQGEGYNTGTAAVFVRFSGCNLQCHFCDTDHHSGIVMSERQIIEAIILKHYTGKRIAIETNGTNPLPDNIDWVTLSPKGAYQGGDTFPLLIDRCDELKVVYTGQPLDGYFKIQATHRFLQPCYCADPELRNANLQATILADPRWRLSLQTHRLLGIR